MDFAGAIKSGLVNAFKFKGTASKKEFWYFYLFLWIVGQFVNLADLAINPGLRDTAIYDDPEYLPTASELLGLLPVASLVVSLLTMIPSLSMTYRRIQDSGRSGKLAFLQFIPLALGVAVIVWFFLIYQTYTGNPYQTDALVPGFLGLLAVALLFLVLQLTWFVFWLIWMLAPTKTAAEGNRYAQQ